MSDYNAVTAVTKGGLVLLINGAQHQVSWAAVGSVAAGVAPVGDGEMFVLALDVDEEEGARLIVVPETEKIWPELTTMLPIGLPEVEPFEHWGATLAETPGAIVLYERANATMAS